MSLISFKDYKIDEIGEVYSGGTPKTSISEYWEGEIGWITPKDLSNYDNIFISHGERNITQKGLDNSSAKLVPKNTVLMTSRAPIGYLAIAENELSTNQGFKSLFCDEDLCYYKYFYYWLKLNIGYIINNSNGSTFKEISGSTFKNLTISLPSLENQKKISSILWNIDGKIENLKKINHNLLKLSKYFYKEFYLDKVELYTDKQYITLDEVTSKFATGLNPRKNFVLGEGNNYYVTIKNMANNSIVLDDKCASITDEAIEKINNRSDLQVGDLLFSGIGTIGRVHLIDEEPTNWNISESVFTMRPNDLISSEFLFIMLLSQEVQEYAKTLASGSVQKGIRMRDLKAYEFILLNEEDRIFLDSLLIPIISNIKANEKEIRYLTKLRDTLLPKLMSGEIDVSEINCDLKLIIKNSY